jgi:ribosomal protein S5
MSADRNMDSQQRSPRDDRRRRDDQGGEAVFQEIVVKVNRCAKVMKGGQIGRAHV